MEVPLQCYDTVALVKRRGQRRFQLLAARVARGGFALSLRPAGSAVSIHTMFLLDADDTDVSHHATRPS